MALLVTGREMERVLAFEEEREHLLEERIEDGDGRS